MFKRHKRFLVLLAFVSFSAITLSASPSVAAPAQPCSVQTINSGSLTCILNAGETISFVMKAGNGGAGGNGGTGGHGAGVMGGMGGAGGSGGHGGSGAKADFSYTNSTASSQTLTFVLGINGSNGTDGTVGGTGLAGTSGTAGGNGTSAQLIISNSTVAEVLPGYGGTGGSGGAPGSPELNMGFTIISGTSGLPGTPGIAGSDAIGSTLSTIYTETPYILISAVTAAQATPAASSVNGEEVNSELAETGVVDLSQEMLVALVALLVAGIGLVLVSKRYAFPTPSKEPTK